MSTILSEERSPNVYSCNSIVSKPKKSANTLQKEKEKFTK